MIGKLIDKASTLKAKLKKDELELNLLQATNDDNWQTSTNVLHEIASSAYSHQKWDKIRQFVYGYLKVNKNWKKILKSLAIIEFLLRNGPTFAIKEIKRDLILFKTFQSFQVYDDGVDRGASVRQKARSIVSLLQNDELLQDQRFKANQIRKNMSKMSTNLSYSSDDIDNNKSNSIPKYQSYNSSSFESRNSQGGYYNYSHGNYGDRDEGINNMTNYYEQSNRFKKVKPQASVKRQQQQKKVQAKKQPINKSTQRQQINKNIYKPDLSYKIKNDEELQIDSQANFQNKRYNVISNNLSNNNYRRNTNQNYNETKINVQENIMSLQQPVKIQSNTINSTSKIQSNQLSDLLGLSLNFQPNKQNNSVSPTLPTVINQNINNHQFTTPTSNTNAIYSNPNQQNNPQTANSSGSALITQQNNPIYSSSQNNPLPTINTSTISNVGYTPQYSPYPPNNMVSNYINNYYAPHVQPINSVYNQHPLQPFSSYSNPYNSYQGYSNIHNPINPIAYNQPVYNPYQNAPYNQYNQYYSPPPPVPSEPYNPYKDNPVLIQAGSLKINSQLNNINFQEQTIKNGKQNSDNMKAKQNVYSIQKVNWLSSKQKNLTDLNDLGVSLSSPIKEQVKKPMTNNIKIDKWAW